MSVRREELDVDCGMYRRGSEVVLNSRAMERIRMGF